MKNENKACIDVKLHKKHRCKCEESPDFRSAYAAEKLMHSITESIGNHCLSRKISMNKLAKLSGLNQKETSMLENGDINITIETLLKIACGLGKKLIITVR